MTRGRPWLPFLALLVVLGVGIAPLSGTRAGGGGPPPPPPPPQGPRPQGAGGRVPRPRGPPLDPNSPKGLGTKGLVEVLRGLGATVDVADTPEQHQTALLLADRLTPAARRRLADWVDGGGTLLLADPSSPLNPFDTTGST